MQRSLRPTHGHGWSNCYRRKLKPEEAAELEVPSWYYGVFDSCEGELMAIGPNPGIAVIRYRQLYPNAPKPLVLA